MRKIVLKNSGELRKLMPDVMFLEQQRVVENLCTVWGYAERDGRGSSITVCVTEESEYRKVVQTHKGREVLIANLHPIKQAKPKKAQKDSTPENGDDTK